MQIMLIPTEELIKELISRYDNAIFVGLKTNTKHGNVYQTRWNGNHATCMGLSEMVKSEILAQYNFGLKPIDTKDI